MDNTAPECTNMGSGLPVRLSDKLPVLPLFGLMTDDGGEEDTDD